MHETYPFRETPGNRTLSSQMDLVASGSYVRSFAPGLYCSLSIEEKGRLTGSLGNRFDNFDEYTRRQYNAKAPHLPNPFGYDEVPNKFSDFDVFLKLRVLHQLSVWTFWNADRIRDKLPEQREIDQTSWVSAGFVSLPTRLQC